ncbi:MAG: signal peptidase I [Thermodesulfobacteriota bacterium]
MKAVTSPQAQVAEKPAKGKLRENVEALVIAILLALFIRAFLIQPFKIPSGSMIPTILVGDQIFVSKFSYGIRMPFTNSVLLSTGRPKRGQIVVFRYPVDRSKDFIKRVIGLPGDVVELRDRRLFINGKQIPDEHARYSLDIEIARRQKGLVDFGPVIIPADKYLMMGDNRDNSSDSREWGFVDFADIRGKALVIYWSWDHWKPRWSRIANILR